MRGTAVVQAAVQVQAAARDPPAVRAPDRAAAQLARPAAYAVQTTIRPSPAHRPISARRVRLLPLRRMEQPGYGTAPARARVIRRDVSPTRAIRVAAHQV